MVWCDNVSEDPGRQWTRSRSHLTRRCGQSLPDCLRRGWREDKYSMCFVSFPCIVHSSSLWLAYWVGPTKIHVALYFRSPNAQYLLVNICATVCRQLYLHSMLPIHSLFTWVLCIWISMGTACTKQHNSMPAGSVGDVCPSALWRITSRTERGQNVDPLVSFWWHVYYLFVTLDREPKETARKEKTVWLILYLYVCVYVYV